MVTIAQIIRLMNAPVLSHDPLHNNSDTASISAVLVLPRDRNYQAPYLVVLSILPNIDGAIPGNMITVDEHVIATVGEFNGQPWSEIADVLLYDGDRPARQGINYILTRYPGCEIAIAHQGRQFLAGTRDGQVIEIFGQVPDQDQASTYGSLLHCWTCSTIPLTILSNAIVIAGRYRTTSEQNHNMLITEQITFRPCPTAVIRHGSPAPAW
jgi:hypothetical protein